MGRVCFRRSLLPSWNFRLLETHQFGGGFAVILSRSRSPPAFVAVTFIIIRLIYFFLTCVWWWRWWNCETRAHTLIQLVSVIQNYANQIQNLVTLDRPEPIISFG